MGSGSATPAPGASSPALAHARLKHIYEQAKKEGKVILLEFSAHWCPSCKEQEAFHKAAFAAMAADPKFGNVVGFKVDYDTEVDLKRQFGITLQNSRVILAPDGQVASKAVGEIWPADKIITALREVMS